MKKRDFLAIGIVALIGVSCFAYIYLNKAPGKSVRVLKDNEVVEVLSLSEDATRDYDYGGKVNTLIIEDGRADVISANCENQVCVNSAPIDDVGETIACLPHGLIFEVVEN